MMDLLTMPASASRRALGIRVLRAHNVQGDGPSVDEQACLGRPGEDYLVGYPMKKSRSHCSMTQTSEGGLGGPDCGFTVTSAPDNAFCVIDTDGDGESACCGKDGSAETSCCCTQAAAHPLLLRHSASSSTIFSSAPSGVSSPSPPALLTSGLPCAASGLSCGASGLSCGACEAPGGAIRPAEPDGSNGAAEALEAARKPLSAPQQQQQQQLQQCPKLHFHQQQRQQQQGARPASATAAAPGRSAAGTEGSNACAHTQAADEEGEGADLMGAFSSLTSDQWAAFQAAVSGGGARRQANHPHGAAGAAGAAAAAAATPPEGGTVGAAAAEGWFALQPPPQPQQQRHHHVHRPQPPPPQVVLESGGGDVESRSEVLAAAVQAAAETIAVEVATAAAGRHRQHHHHHHHHHEPEQPAEDAVPAAAAAVAAAVPAVPACDSSSGAVAAVEMASTGDSNGSIASLWAAVNSVTGAAVYDSTDDSAAAGQLLDSHNSFHHLQYGHRRGWSSTTGGPSPAPRVPAAQMVVSSGSGQATTSVRQLPQEHHTHQYDRQYNRQYDHQQTGDSYRNLAACLVARHTHHAGCAAAPISQPDSPAGRTSSLTVERGCSGSNLFVTTRNMLLREMAAQPQELQQANGPGAGAVAAVSVGASAGMGVGVGVGYEMGVSSSASITADGNFYAGEDQYDSHGAGGGGGSGYIRAAAAVRSNAHSRYSMDLPHCSPRHFLHNQQQQQVQQMQQMQQMQLQLQQQQQQQVLQPPVAAAAAAAPPPSLVNGHPPGSPSRRRAGGALAQPSSYTTYGYRRARSSLAAMEQGIGGAAAICPGDGDGSSSDDDDTEEATRRITAAFKTHSGMTRSSGWGLLGADSAPTTPGAEAARRDHWAAAATAAHGGAAAGSASGAAGGGAGGGSATGGFPAMRDGGAGAASVETGEQAEAGARCGACGGWSGGDVMDGDGGPEEEEGEGGLLTRKRSSYHLTNSHAAVELFLRLNHARQTMDFVKRQTQLFAGLDKAHMSVWEALQTLNELREYEAVLMAEGSEAQEVAELSLLDHAFQTAELCRLHHPTLDWLHLVGLLHGLGKLLAHRRFGSQPQWAICGETYPLGCRFSPHILGSQYFTANPDRRRRLYNTATGLYDSGCGLLNVVMSWSAPEYLYLVLSLNASRLPQDALWVLRHAKFLTLTRPHSCYLPLCSGDDLRRLPLLRSFQSLAAYRRVALPEGFGLGPEDRTAYYCGLIDKYIGSGPLHW